MVLFPSSILFRMKNFDDLFIYLFPIGVVFSNFPSSLLQTLLDHFHNEKLSGMISMVYLSYLFGCYSGIVKREKINIILYFKRV